MMTNWSALLRDGDFQKEQSPSYGQTETQRCDGETKDTLPAYKIVATG
jgi:hypothetical protein